jgi:hypothetical protein
LNPQCPVQGPGYNLSDDKVISCHHILGNVGQSDPLGDSVDFDEDAAPPPGRELFCVT